MGDTNLYIMNEAQKSILNSFPMYRDNKMFKFHKFIFLMFFALCKNFPSSILYGLLQRLNVM